MGAGDLVAAALAAAGITGERVERWLGRPCGCRERRERLNALARWARRTPANGAGAAAAWLDELLRTESRQRNE